MKREYWNKIFQEWFDLTNETKIIYYRNPDDCKSFQMERVNPDHKGVIWGKRKDKSLKNWIRVCRLIFANCIMFINDTIRGFFVYLFGNVNVADIPFFIFYILAMFLFYQMIFTFSGMGVIFCLQK